MKIICMLLSILLSGFSVSGQNQTGGLDSKSEANSERLEIVMERIGRNVQKNLESIVKVVFTEVVRQQQLKADTSPKGKPKNYVYESIVTNRASNLNTENYQPIFTRTLKSIDGKQIKGQPPLENSKCEQLNPQAAYENPLVFLLPKNQPNYIFAHGGENDVQGNKTIIITVSEKTPSEPLRIVEKNDCFFLSRPLRLKGQIWIDSKTSDIVQIKWEQAETFSATIPKKTIKAGIIPVVRPEFTISYDKQDFTVGFRQVKFQNPELTLLLPYFSESVSIDRGAKLPGMRTIVDYTQYRLFNTTVQVNELEKQSNR